MKYFQSIRKVLEGLGIYQPEPLQNHTPSLRTVLRLSCLTLFSILTFGFFISEAKTLLEFADCFYIFTTSIFLFSVILTLTMKSPKIFELMNNFEIEIERRKLMICIQNILLHSRKFLFRNEREFHIEAVIRKNTDKNR